MALTGTKLALRLAMIAADRRLAWAVRDLAGTLALELLREGSPWIDSTNQDEASGVDEDVDVVVKLLVRAAPRPRRLRQGWGEPKR